jgi:hypothetical protein
MLAFFDLNRIISFCYSLKPVPPHLGQPPSIPPKPMQRLHVVNLVELGVDVFSGLEVDFLGMRLGAALRAPGKGFSFGSRFLGACVTAYSLRATWFGRNSDAFLRQHLVLCYVRRIADFTEKFIILTA